MIEVTNDRIDKLIASPDFFQLVMYLRRTNKTGVDLYTDKLLSSGYTSDDIILALKVLDTRRKNSR